MKKVTFGIVAVLLIALGISAIVSCEKEEYPQYQKKLSVSDFEYVGKLHNDGLDYSFDKLKNKEIKVKSFNEIEKLQEKLTVEFINAQNFSDDVKKIAVSYVKEKIAFSENNNFYKSSSNDFLPDSLKSHLSLEAQTLLSNLFEIMNDSDTNLTSLQERISEIEKVVIEKLDVKEQFVILTSSSVAKYSLKYWKENLDKWKSLVDYSNKSIDNIDWKGAGKADLQGAALTAISVGVSPAGAAMASAGPSGWAAYGLVVVGGGLESSAMSVLWDLFS